MLQWHMVPMVQARSIYGAKETLGSSRSSTPLSPGLI